jgi:hypothetical protein
MAINSRANRSEPRRCSTLRSSRSTWIIPCWHYDGATALRIGDPVLTIGNPLRLGMSVSGYCKRAQSGHRGHSLR